MFREDSQTDFAKKSYFERFSQTLTTTCLYFSFWNWWSVSVNYLLKIWVKSSLGQ